MELGIIHARVLQMRDAARVIRESAYRIEDCIDAVDAEVKAIGSDRYVSPAADEFRREYARLTLELKRASEHLMLFHEKLALSADEIEAASRPVQ